MLERVQNHRGYGKILLKVNPSYSLSSIILPYVLIMFLLQNSIEDKLSKLESEKRNIDEEIGRVMPELQKVLIFFITF